ncbi:MAG: YebC/PmpR family DNA-binding transcriptional regulator [Candidatus Gastranaerophilales bacterium]|nr:YebC/PmpR family DNA-binding transcriptional regulator [Candidatus Gastranaerophilales bacterium]
MSGHSKWSTIKHKKAKIDAQRGVAFQKFSRELIVAAKLGGGDPASNFRLRTAIDRAKQAGLPNDNIKRAIEKGAGSAGADNYEELTYEGYGAGGTAIIVEAMTDNRNRTAGDLRSYFTKFNGNLGENGCVGWMFKQVGLITFEKEVDFDALFEAAIEADAQDVIEEDDEYKVITAVPDFQSCVETLEASGFKSQSAELTRLPENSIDVTDEKTAINILRLMDKLEEHDDVQNVYSNFEIDDELAEKIADKI